ncbi:hypothetical protein LEP1GSC051_3752 [Leptospira sp. P2653]|nr:hypothetical protein LEP1GSC051_3752 [Leptospira sp. P2653]
MDRHSGPKHRIITFAFCYIELTLFYRVRTGIQWRYISPMFGSKSTLNIT